MAEAESRRLRWMGHTALQAIQPSSHPETSDPWVAPQYAKYAADENYQEGAGWSFNEL